jgi:transposase
MSKPFDQSTLTTALEALRDDPDALIAIILRQAERIGELEAMVAALQARLDELEQRPPRSVAPFRMDESNRSQQPGKPGRKAGHVGCFRPPIEATEHITVALEVCPCCGGAISELEPVEQLIEEIAPVCPRRVRLITYKGRCARCGLVRSTHPLQTSTAVGAAGTQIGPATLSVLAKLRYQWHLSTRKSAQILKSLCGLSISPGGLVAAMSRLSERLSEDDQRRLDRLRAQAVVYSDETGWYVGAPGYGLWVFTNACLTIYRIVQSRSRAALQAVIGSDFEGVLVSDCLSIYDEASPVQHKCYRHHLNAISEAIEAHPQQGEGFLREIKTLLEQAMRLKKERDALEPAAYRQRVAQVKAQAEGLLSMPRGQPQEETIRQRLVKQKDHLFTFLDYEQVEATNNQAERQLRPAVIARKVSCGNRTLKGARTFEVLASLAATCHQTGQDLAEALQVALAQPIQSATTR